VETIRASSFISHSTNTFNSSDVSEEEGGGWSEEEGDAKDEEEDDEEEDEDGNACVSTPMSWMRALR
jgi:hypothetical protein